MGEALTLEARGRGLDARRSESAAGVEALEEPSPEIRRLLERMRSAVARYVRERRAAGIPIERVVPEVKVLVREAESCEAWRDPSDALVARAVRWSIEAYDDDGLPHVPRFY